MENVEVSVISVELFVDEDLVDFVVVVVVVEVLDNRVEVVIIRGVVFTVVLVTGAIFGFESAIFKV